MYSMTSIPMPKLYGTGRLILGREIQVKVAYVIWRWQAVTQVRPSAQPREHDVSFSSGVLAVPSEYCCPPDIDVGLLRLEDGAEFAVKLSRLSNPNVWEFQIQFAAGACPG
jgi:hypothetical protein